MTAKQLGDQPAYPVNQMQPSPLNELGMTKREEFAKAAMQATLSNPIAMSTIVDIAVEKNLSSNQLLAQSSLAIADALLAAEPDDSEGKK